MSGYSKKNINGMFVSQVTQILIYKLHINVVTLSSVKDLFWVQSSTETHKEIFTKETKYFFSVTCPYHSYTICGHE